MDIGSEISKKIQLAIKAKLVELNAYVDDELPDYIMIMIANRKPESQMAEALSLFLADNTSVFTKWLYELLAALRNTKVGGSSSDTKPPVATTSAVALIAANTDTEPTDTANVSGIAKENVINIHDCKEVSILNNEQPGETSKKSESSQSLPKQQPAIETQIKPAKPVKKRRRFTETPNEDAVIDIRHDSAFDDELFADVVSSDKVSSLEIPAKVSSSSEKVETKISHSVKEHNSKKEKATSNHKSEKAKVESKSKKQPSLPDSIQATDARNKLNSTEAFKKHKKSTKEPSEKVSTSKHKKSSSEKRSVLVKSSKLSSVDKECSSKIVENSNNKRLRDPAGKDSATSTVKSTKQPSTDKEFSSRIVENSSYKRSRDVTAKDGSTSAKLVKPVKNQKLSGSDNVKVESQRDWDKGKYKDNQYYDKQMVDNKSNTITQSKRQKMDKCDEKDEDDRSVISKVASKVVMSTVQSAVKEPQYLSDEDDETDISKSFPVVSKVAVPEKRPRLPRSKQANRSLLLKAVSEAEDSIRKHRSMLIKKNLSTDTQTKMFIKELETLKHQPTKALQKEKQQFKIDPQCDIRIKKDVNPKQNSQKRKKIKLLKRKITQNVSSVVTEDSQSDEMLKYKHDTDSRHIVARDNVNNTTSHLLQEGNVPPKLDDVLSTGSGEPVLPSVQFDLRQLSSKETDKEASKSEKMHIELSKAKSPEPTSAKSDRTPPNKKQKRASSPCFIVTLDGSVDKEKSSGRQSVKEKKSEAKTKVFVPIPVQAPGPKVSDQRPPKVIQSSNVQSDQKSVLEKADAESDNDIDADLDLRQMREKLLKMQEEAKKLKDVQAAQLLMLQKSANISSKSLPTSSAAKPDEQKSIHIANVHFSATEKQLSEHFSVCGKVRRVTILKDVYTGKPKGFAYLEFEEENSVDMALALDNTPFCTRNIKVTKKQSEIDAAVTQLSYSSSRFFPGRPSRRGWSRGYRPRFQSAPRFQTRTRFAVPKNRTWVKPGYIPA